MWIPCFIPLYSPLNLYFIILWILDFKYISLLLLFNSFLVSSAASQTVDLDEFYIGLTLSYKVIKSCCNKLLAQKYNLSSLRFLDSYELSQIESRMASPLTLPPPRHRGMCHIS